MNGMATLWFWDDLGAIARPRLAGVVLPKAEDPDEISEVTSRLPEEASVLRLLETAAGILPPLDGVTAALDDPDRLAEDVDHARRLGFGGKLCIHPEQIEAVNRGFVPSEAEALWVRRVLEAAGAAGMEAVRFEGEMIDRPVIERARRILARVTHQG